MWDEVMAAYQLDGAHLLLLVRACEARDVAAAALSELTENGSSVPTSDGGSKGSPALGAWRDATGLELRVLSLMGLPGDQDRRDARGRFTLAAVR